MADEDLKMLGQSAADIPRILAARMDKVQTVAMGLEDLITQEVFLKQDLGPQFDKVEQQIRSFLDDAETEVDQLHTICEKLWTKLEEASEGTSEGAKRISLELENLTSEVASLDSKLQTETARVEDAMLELNRLHEEMEGVATLRLPIVTDAYKDLETKYDGAKTATTEFEKESQGMYLKLQQNCEKQKSRMEAEVTTWGERLDGSVDTLTNTMAEEMQKANARVVELLGGVESFFQSEVVGPATQKSDALQDKVGLFKQALDEAAAQAKDARGWVPTTIQRIEESTNPLDALIIQTRDLGKTFGL